MNRRFSRLSTQGPTHKPQNSPYRKVGDEFLGDFSVGFRL